MKDQFELLQHTAGGFAWHSDFAGAPATLPNALTLFTGQGDEAAHGMGWLNTAESASHAVIHQALAVLAEDGPPQTLKLRIQRADGVWRDMKVVVMHSPQEAALVWCGLDCTERTARERELAELRQTLRQARLDRLNFLNNMGHELRTPLSAVIGYTELLADDAQDGGHTGLLDDLRIIAANAHQMQQIIDDALVLSRIESGEVMADPALVDISAVLALVAEDTAMLAGQRRATLRVQAQAGMPLLYTDADKLRQCLRSLVTIALQQTEESEVQLSGWADAATGSAVFVVRDGGMGMEAAEVAALLQPFAAMDPYAHRSVGTTLSLNVTRAMADLLGGTLEIDTAYGVGTIFTLRLRGADTRATPSGASHAPS